MVNRKFHIAPSNQGMKMNALKLSDGNSCDELLNEKETAAV
jgi:hypothetical protein